jgi:hypothetical protein
VEDELEIPLSMQGVISGFTTWLPTEAELEDFSTHIKIMWDPYLVAYSKRRELMTKFPYSGVQDVVQGDACRKITPEHVAKA